MSNSNTLRQTHRGLQVFGSDAKDFEANLKEVSPKVVQELKSLYPELKFELIKRLHKKELHAQLKCLDIIPEYHSDNPYIQPDMGAITVTGDFGTKIIFIGEAKKQGTNDIRHLEGKKPQAQGNAIERMYKNIEEGRIFFSKESYFSYAIFCKGCDFVKGSSILDRLSAATYYYPFNQAYIEKVNGQARTSIFIEPEGFSQSFVFDTALHMCQESLRCILKNS